MEKKRKNCLKLAAVATFIFVHAFIYAQWPQWRGLMRDGSSSETNLLRDWPAEGPRLLWSSDTIGDGYGSAIIQDKVIYVPGTKDSSEIITAFDLNGKILWQKRYGKALKESPGWMAQVSTPTFYKNKLYAYTASGDISCVSTATGKVDWTVSIPGKFEGAIGCKSMFCESPLVADDKVILTPCSKNHTLIALNSSTGETVWASESIADTGNFVSPFLIQGKDKKVVVTNTQKYYLAADLSTGKIVWKERGSAAYVPLPVGMEIYFSSFKDGGKMFKINDALSSYDFQWCDSLKIKVMGGAVKLGNRIFGTFENRKGVFCVDWVSGKKLIFENDIRGANLLAADGMIYSYEDRSGRVSLLKPTDNTIDIAGTFKITLGNGANLAHMSLSNGILFIRHGKTLMAYDIKKQ